jgi:hypothetical protein
MAIEHTFQHCVSEKIRKWNLWMEHRRAQFRSDVKVARFRLISYIFTKRLDRFANFVKLSAYDPVLPISKVVGIRTRYGMVSPGIESRWGRDFPHPASCTIDTGSFPGVKRPGRGTDHPSPSSAEDKGRVQLYTYSPSWPSWPVRE